MVSVRFDLEALVVKLFPVFGFRDCRVWALLACSRTYGSRTAL